MKTKWVIFLLAAAVISAAACLLLQDRRTGAVTARITRDGVLLEEIALERVEQPYSFTLEDGSGSNTLAVERGRIRVAEADCPDQVCVRQGWISDGTVPIICLPHRLVIEIAGAGEDLDGGAG